MLLLDQSDAACDLIGPDGTEGGSFQLGIGRGWIRAPASEETLLMIQGQERAGSVKRLAGRERGRRGGQMGSSERGGRKPIGDLISDDNRAVMHSG